MLSYTKIRAMKKRQDGNVIGKRLFGFTELQITKFIRGDILYREEILR